MRPILLSLAALLLAVGCATQATVETRRTERISAYNALPADERALVDQGQIRAGMGEDAVYIAWGKPAQVLRSGDASGEQTTWLYHGTATDSYHYWAYREYPRKDGSTYLDRSMETDYNFRDYVSAELTFRGGKLERWRMLPKPAEGNYYAPNPVRY
jgi:hypothetical protein